MPKYGRVGVGHNLQIFKLTHQNLFIKQEEMVWIRIAGISGGTAVAAGAIGAHLLPKKGRSPEIVEVYNTGARYHLLHSVILASCAMALPAGRKRTICCALFTSGIVLFSGSCYAVAAANQRKPYSYAAPFGGFALIGAWVVLGTLP